MAGLSGLPSPQVTVAVNSVAWAPPATSVKEAMVAAAALVPLRSGARRPKRTRGPMGVMATAWRPAVSWAVALSPAGGA